MAKARQPIRGPTGKPCHIIYKYPFAIEDEFDLELSPGAQVLRVAVQDSQPHLWALVDPECPDDKKQTRHFEVWGTGLPMEEPEKRVHVGTFLMAGGKLVWHLFERIE
jgi:hypothetical protein